jgi:DNA polymerase-3 subunit delta
MNNCYYIENIDDLVIDKKIDELINKLNFTDIDKTVYDLENTPLYNALVDLDTYNFLQDRKIIIIRGLDKISISKQEYDINSDLEHLYKYISNPNKDNLLIIRTNNLNKKTNIYKNISKLCETIKTEIDSKDYIKEKLNGYILNTGVIRLLDEYCNNNISKIDNECNKLINYKINDKIITKDDIEELVTKELGDSSDLTFSLIRSIGQKNIKNALKEFNDLKEYDPSILGLISLLESQLRLMYQVKILEKLKDEDIASKLNIKSSYRITKTKELTRLYTKDEIGKIINKLEQIDIKMKSTDLDNIGLLEDFIIEITK